MKKLLVGMVLLSCSYSQLIASNNYQDLFVGKVLDCLESKPNLIDGHWRKAKEYLFKADAFDVDAIKLNDVYKKKSGCSTLGELLNRVAEGKIELSGGNPLEAQSYAQCLVALVFYHRSQRSLYHDPAETLRRLINNAIYLTDDFGSRPVDWSDQNLDLSKIDPKLHFRTLWIFFFATTFDNGYYDLSQISVRWNGGETIYDYLERESKKNMRVQNVYNLLKQAMKNTLLLKVPDKFADVDTAYYLGNVPNGLFTVPASGTLPITQVGKKDSLNGASFFTIPRILMALGAGLIAGYIIYKRYYAEPKDGAEESIGTKDVLAATQKAVRV